MSVTVDDSRNRIAALQISDDRLVVEWGDGHRSDFHYVWLRDNCMCSTCGDKSGGHRYLELNDIPLDIAPRAAKPGDGGSLDIEWTADGHRSRFDTSWLRAHCYSESERRQRRTASRTWDRRLTASLPTSVYDEVMSNDAARLTMFQQLHEFGFVVIRGVGRKKEGVTHVADLFGFIRRTHYGRIFELIATPEQRILAQTSHAILPHNDELFRTPIPGLLCMHCVQACADGGGAFGSG